MSDREGEPVRGVEPCDVEVCVDAAAAGWAVSPPVRASDGVMCVNIVLEEEEGSSDTATLCVSICGQTVPPFTLQVSRSVAWYPLTLVHPLVNGFYQYIRSPEPIWPGHQSRSVSNVRVCCPME